MDLRFTELKSLTEAAETLPTTSARSSTNPTTLAVVLQHQLWTCSEVSVAVVCAFLLSLFGFLRTLDGSLSFVQEGVASRMNMAAPFVYATAFVISAVHYAFLTLPRTSATLRQIDVCVMAITLAYMTTLLIVDSASQTAPERPLLPGFRVAAWIDAPAAATVFVVVIFLSRSFTPSALTSTYELQEPLLTHQAPREDRDKQALLKWHASLDSGVLSHNVQVADFDQPSAELRLEMDQLLRLARASGLLSTNPSSDPSDPLTNTTASLSYPQTMSPSLLDNKSKPNQTKNVVQMTIRGMDARSSHTHFDPAWDWVRQCLLGVLIVSWINQLALLTNGLRVRANQSPPEVALTQSLSSIALLFSAYFQFVNCPRPVYLLGPILWRLIAFLGVCLTIVASDVMLLPWQTTL
jgi:hypothetical protein